MIRILEWDALSASDRISALARPAQESRADIAATAAQVVNTVRRQGDAALFSYTERFDSVKLDSLAVSAEEFADARRALTPKQLAALEAAIANVQQFHVGQLPQPLVVETTPGVRCERIVRAISTVGLYVPAGSAPLPSAVIMLAVPARIAGCPNRILCTPPARNGKANPAVLVAAELCGIGTVFKVGGAQAIAALAYGTQTIPKADKIFGPGNAFVTAAKQLVAADPAGAACDMPAGPSEVMVVADDNANAEFVASDLLAQAEHDTQAQAILVTSSRRLAEAVASEVEKQTALLSRRAILQESLTASRCVVVSDIAAAIEVANLYAAEHLILEVEEPRQWLPRIQNAGSVFLGAWSPEPMGDYCSGTNHVLPTYGYARAYSGLSVLDFVKGITVQELSPAGLQGLGPVAVELAKLEGLDAHASAVSRRLDVLSRGVPSPNGGASTGAWNRPGAGATPGTGATSAGEALLAAANTGGSGHAGAAS
jgi:histidinol dehydrogenase